MKISNFNKGVALYLGILIMLIMLTLGIGVSLIILGQLKTIKGMGKSVVAIYAADTGIERILYQDKLCRQLICPDPNCTDLEDDGFCDRVAEDFSLQDEPLGEGITYSVEVSPADPYIFRSLGEFDNVNRAIEIFVPYYKRVFITSQIFNGNLRQGCYDLTGNIGCYSSGITAADLICQYLAENASPSLPGTYKAWISTENDWPANRFTQSLIPYRLVNGTLIAENWDDLTDGTLRNSINRDESGSSPGSQFVWTNTTPSGLFVAGDKDCETEDGNWLDDTDSSQGRYGDSSSTDANWTNASDIVCNVFGSGFSLYCFQQ
jgi:hypothetical protein